MAPEPIELPLYVNLLVSAGGFALLAFLGPRTFRTPLWMPILLLCSGIAGYALLEGAHDLAVDVGDQLLAEQLSLAAMSGLPVAIAGLLHLSAIYPRRMETKAVSAGLLAAYGCALFSVFLAPTRLVLSPSNAGPPTATVLTGTISDLLLYPLAGGLVLVLIWFILLSVRPRNPAEQKSSMSMAVSIAMPLVLAVIFPISGLVFAEGEQSLLLIAIWLVGLGFAIASGKLPLPLQASLRRVMESSPDAIAIIDGDRAIVTMNSVARSLLSPPAGFVGHPYDKVLEPTFSKSADWPSIREKLEQALNASDPGARHSMELVGPKGEPLRLLIDPLGKASLARGSQGAVMRFSDIRNEKAAEVAARQAQQLQDLVIRVMGHDLKAPIMVIGGYLQLAEGRLSGPLDDKSREALRSALQKAGQAASMMNVTMANARAISRLTVSQNAPATFEPIDLSKLVHDVSEVLRPLADAKQVTLKLEKPERLIVPLLPGFESVITNLLSNAIKFTPAKGEVGVKIVSDESHVGIEVWDSGPGIAPESRYKLFQKFERLGTTFDRAEGHGLGLSIAAQIVELSGGTIAVGDKEDGSSGASFTVELPLEQPKGPATSPA